MKNYKMSFGHMTITRVPTGETPFRLTFGTEAVILVKVD